MFSEARLTRSLRPCPPTPTAATFNKSLGAVMPRPSTWRGTMAKPAVVTATCSTKRRLEMSAMIVCLLTGTAPDDLRLLDLADTNVAEGERAFVVALERNVSAPRTTVVRVGDELAGFHLGQPVGAFELILEQLHPVQPVLDVRSARDDACAVPVADRLQVA